MSELKQHLWERLTEDEKEMVTYLASMAQPVSIDALISISGEPVVKVLNIMEGLRKRKVLRQKRGYPGLYFLNAFDHKELFDNYISRKKAVRALNKIIGFYETSFSGEKKLFLADLYIAAGDCTEDRLKKIKITAEGLYASNEKERAVPYYDYVIRALTKTRMTGEKSQVLIESILDKISATEHLMPVKEQISLLSKAQRTAKRYKKWDLLAKIKLRLGQLLQFTGQPKKAFRYMHDFWALATRVDDPQMLKTAVLLMTEFLYWKGKYAEVVRRYEKAVGNLEEFGNDETSLRATARVGQCYVRCGRISRGMGMIDAVRSKANNLGLQQISIFCDLLSTLALFEILKTSEAEFYMNRIYAQPQEVVGHFVMWPVDACKSYILCFKGEKRSAFDFLKKAIEHSRFVGWIHHSGPWNFDNLDALESAGFVHDEMNYDAEIKRMLNWDNAYMRGVGFRYKALRGMKKEQQPISRVLSDLKNSEKYLRKAGGEIELARTRIALGEAYLKKGQRKTAGLHLAKAWAVLSHINRSLFPENLLHALPGDHQVELMIDRITGVNESLGTIHDTSAFLEKVVGVAMDFTLAMRGAFFAVEEGKEPIIIASRNLDPMLFTSRQFQPVKEIIRKTATERGECLMPDPDAAGVGTFAGNLLRRLDISALLCMPAVIGQKVHGCLYLDSRVGGDIFPYTLLPYLRLLCSQIAVGLSNISTFKKMKEQNNRLEDEAELYKRELGLPALPHAIISRAEGMKIVIEQSRRAAAMEAPVLLTGEPGVGKELLAKLIHSAGPRGKAAFVPFNPAGFDSREVYRALFGPEKDQNARGEPCYSARIELADEGTLFIKEIGGLPLQVQDRLLQAIQTELIEQQGNKKTISSNFRLIAATKYDLLHEVEKGQFRRSLYDRLAGFTISVPPLRTRKSDISLLCMHFIAQFTLPEKQLATLPTDELKALMTYDWPGNVQELRQTIERAVGGAQTGKITVRLGEPSAPLSRREDLPMLTLVEFEREYIERVLRAVHWKLSGPNSASSVLAIKPTTLLFRMKKLGIKKPILTG